MSGYREQIVAAVRAVTLASPTSFAWFGTSSRPLPAALIAALPAGTARAYLVDALQRELYRSFFTQGRPVPARPDRGAPHDPAFAAALADANAGAGGWAPGWRVEAVAGDRARIVRAGLSVETPARDCHASPTVGALVAVRRPNALRAAAPGWYIALGDADLPPGDGLEVRVYFHVTAAGAAPLVAATTRGLNAAAVPFRLKVLDHPTGFDRCDAAVLYLPDGGFDRARAALRAIAAACAPHLRDDAPAFARPLLPGVAVGEHRPRLGASFGSSRCRLVAEGIVAARARDAEARVAAVAARFADHGLDVEAPYRAPGSTRRYAL